MDTRGKQLGALGFCASTVPAILILPSVGWLWAGLACGTSAVLLAVLLHLNAKSPVPLVEAAGKRTFGKILLAVLFLWNVVALGVAAKQLCAAFPTAGDGPLVGLLLLLLAAYSTGKGRSLPVAAICFFFLLGLYSLLFGFSLPNLNLEYLRPGLPPSWAKLTAALLPLNLLYLCRCKTGKPYPWLVGGVLFCLLAVLVTVGSLSPSVAVNQEFPFYEAAKSVTLIGSIQRLEPLVSAGLCLGGFCLLSLLCSSNERFLEILRPQSKKLGSLINFFGGGLCFWLTRWFSGGAVALGTTIFWGFFPFLLLLVGKEKNIKNF